MLGLWFWQKYSNRPIHLFGATGLFLVVSGGGILSLLLVLRLFKVISLYGRIWPMIAVFLILAGVQLFVTGLMADIAVKSYYKQHKQTPYNIKEIINK